MLKFWLYRILELHLQIELVIIFWIEILHTSKLVERSDARPLLFDLQVLAVQLFHLVDLGNCPVEANPLEGRLLAIHGVALFN